MKGVHDIFIFDDNYVIVKRSANRKRITLSVTGDGKISLLLPSLTSDKEAFAFLEQKKLWLRNVLNKQAKQKEKAGSVEKLTRSEFDEIVQKALEIIPQRVKIYAPLIGVDYGRITIRNQKTRWGSCSSKGNLNFNCMLMLAPIEVIDAIVVHELCHRKEMNHSDRFYRLVYKAYPEYDKWNKWLKDNGSNIMARMP